MKRKIIFKFNNIGLKKAQWMIKFSRQCQYSEILRDLKIVELV